MLNNDDFLFMKEALQSSQVETRVAALQELEASGPADERLIPLLQNLLNDHTPAMLSIPIRIGEIRWLAFHALSEVLYSLGKNEKISLTSSITPLDTRKLHSIRKEANLPTKPGLPGLLETFQKLQELGKLPTKDIALEL